MKISTQSFSKRAIAVFLFVTFLTQVTACGTILYPERQGRSNSGQIDVAIAVLDSVGFLFLIIPGVVAWAVDYNNGAIYLPKGKKYSKILGSAKGREASSGEIVKIKLEKLDSDTIERTIVQQTGLQVRLDDPKLIKRKVEPGVNIDRELVRLNSEYN